MSILATLSLLSVQSCNRAPSSTDSELQDAYSRSSSNQVVWIYTNSIGNIIFKECEKISTGEGRDSCTQSNTKKIVETSPERLRKALKSYLLLPESGQMEGKMSEDLQKSARTAIGEFVTAFNQGGLTRFNFNNQEILLGSSGELNTTNINIELNKLINQIILSAGPSNDPLVLISKDSTDKKTLNLAVFVTLGIIAVVVAAEEFFDAWSRDYYRGSDTWWTKVRHPGDRGGNSSGTSVDSYDDYQE
jgi:hypothetical protein